ncbi:MAG: GTPase [Candidatus Woesearchaeota archaeon]
MAIPHKEMRHIIKKRLTGLTGKARIKEIERIQKELPGFNTGQYGLIKKELKEEITKTKTRSSVQHNEFYSVRKEGHRQFCLVGQPSSGKSSIVKALCGLQTKVAAYAFTTLKPIPGIVKVNHAEFQLVDLPGLVEGAYEDVGKGRQFIGIVHGSDGYILVADLTKPVSEVKKIEAELSKAGIAKKRIIVGNKLDCAPIDQLRQAYPEDIVIGVSAETGEGLDELKDKIWEISDLIRVGLAGGTSIHETGTTVQEVARSIHKDFRFTKAKVTGPSVKFPNQTVSSQHVLQDTDKLYF